MSGHETANASAPVPLSGEGDPFGDGQSWFILDQDRDEHGQIVRVLYECRYLIESGDRRAWVTERRWHDGEHESRDVEPLG
ncbi:hypothetical protein [Nocardia lijiangensis]|uniref:hypothetical protein n=1 Tax=Nocardia lijiangensis TaxID=299618 RepID=UPI0008361EFF|nr:hypothetical protein [Nocardia lijiangensis]